MPIFPSETKAHRTLYPLINYLATVGILSKKASLLNLWSKQCSLMGLARVKSCSTRSPAAARFHLLVRSLGSNRAPMKSTRSYAFSLPPNYGSHDPQLF